MLLGLSVLVVVSIAIISYSQLEKRNLGTTVQQGIYTNTAYGFQIASSNVSNPVDPMEGGDGIVDPKTVQYAIDATTVVTIVSNVEATTYADALISNAGSYLVQHRKVTINNKEAEYLEMGFANGTRTHDYVFSKGADSIIVSIHLPKSESPQAIINSFVFK